MFRPRGARILLPAMALMALVACAGPAIEGAGSPQRPVATARPGRAGSHAVPEGGFASPVGRDHPLAGAILRTEDGVRMSWPDLVDALSPARAVLLGEKHDNPDHHRLQARLYAALSAVWHAGGGARPAPAVVFEMLDASDHRALAEVLHRPDVAPRDIAAAVAWDTSGWPSFALYEPIFAAVLGAGEPGTPVSIVAAGLPRKQTMALARGQALPAVGPFEAGIEARYGVDQPLPETHHAALRELMVDAHCGMLPDEMLDGMVRIQRLRDALMAEGLRLAIAQHGRGVLIAGAGHVRRDRAVPALLQRVGVDDVLSVAFVEVSAQAQSVSDYIDADTRAGFDFVVLTAALPYEDHCAALRKRFSGASKDHAAGP